jgi:hypothetical protein
MRMQRDKMFGRTANLAPVCGAICRCEERSEGALCLATDVTVLSKHSLKMIGLSFLTETYTVTLGSW